MQVAEPSLWSVDDEMDTLQVQNDEPPLDMFSRVCHASKLQALHPKL